MSMHYDSESLVDRGRSPRLFALLVFVTRYNISTLSYKHVLKYFKSLLNNKTKYIVFKYGIIYLLN